LKTAPKRADLRAALGESFFHGRQDREAIDEFKALIDLDPRRSYAFWGFPPTFGRFDEAKKYFRKG